MDLHDYVYVDPLRTDFDPRPKASQVVAAAKRAAAGRPTHDTEPIAPIALPSTTRKYVPFGIGALVLILLMIGAASYQLGRMPQAKPLQITPQPTMEPTGAPAAAVSAPAPSAAPTATPATIPAYAAPDGLLLGQIELDRMIVPVAHFGRAWIQADVHGSGLVWLRASDVPDIALTGPDLAPRAAAPQTGQGLTLDQTNEWTQPTATPDTATAPEPTATVVWATPAPAKIPDFDQPDIKGTCQFVGCLGEKAVDLARAQACHALYWQYGDVTDEDTNVPAEDMKMIRACVWEGLYE